MPTCQVSPEGGRSFSPDREPLSLSVCLPRFEVCASFWLIVGPSRWGAGGGQVSKPTPILALGTLRPLPPVSREQRLDRQDLQGRILCGGWELSLGLQVVEAPAGVEI